MIIAVDFDGTIVEHRYPEIGKPIPFAFDVLRRLIDEGQHTLILWSVREDELLEEAVQFCADNGVRFYAANKNYPEEKVEEASRKLNADIFIDDRNLGGLPDWGVIYKLIKAGGDKAFNFDEMINSDERYHQKTKKNFFIRLGEAWDRAKGNNY